MVIRSPKKKGTKQIPEDRIRSYLNRSTLIDTQSSFKLNKRLNENTAREGNGKGKPKAKARQKPVRMRMGMRLGLWVWEWARNKPTACATRRTCPRMSWRRVRSESVEKKLTTEIRMRAPAGCVRNV